MQCCKFGRRETLDENVFEDPRVRRMFVSKVLLIVAVSLESIRVQIDATNPIAYCRLTWLLHLGPWQFA